MKLLCLGILLACAGPAQTARVWIYDQAGTPASLLDEMRETVIVVMRYAGVAVQVRICGIWPCEEPSTQVTYLVRLKKGRVRGRMGLAYVSQDKTGYIDVYPEAASEFAMQTTPNCPVLGYILAHEIGHMLMGPDSHAASGVMRASWKQEDASLMAWNRLRFSDAEAARMREAVGGGVASGASYGRGFAESGKLSFSRRVR
jgi:hypothetical protein